MKLLSRVRLFATPWTAAYQAPPSMDSPGKNTGVPTPSAISFSNAWRWTVKVKSLSPVRLWATPWTAAYRAPPSMGFSRQEYWSGVPLPSPLQYKVKYFLKNRKKKKVRSLITWQRIKKLIIVKYLLCTIQGSGLQWAYCLVEKINIKHFFLLHLLIVTVEQ